ncbi:hypothetical protein [Embleya hyalina]|uniref:Uncharacterized protein n=1 Tax=Embleya hyalina TaxID=516124 RepID=A0A401YYS0_9ACTN|nr:hypothetical protein [Embleya hyalina]GCD99776.1 hypothetical protein EHYA_07498 [Embleya hyalina]
MDLPQAHGYLVLPGFGDVEVTLDLFDRPTEDEALPRAWTAIVDGTPVPAAGVEGVLHLDTEPTLLGHRFVVAVAGDHVAQIIGHDPR